MAEIDDYEKAHGAGSSERVGGKAKHRSKSSGSSSKKSSGSGSGSSSKDNSQDSYQIDMATSLQEEYIPHQVKPFHVNHMPGNMAKYGMNSANTRSGYIKVTLSTISGTYPLVPRSISHSVPGNTEEQLIGDLISVQVQNDMQNDIPTCTFVLGNTHDWSSLLAVNDLIRIDYIVPFAQSDGQPLWNNTAGYGGVAYYTDTNTPEHAPQGISGPSGNWANNFQNVPKPNSYSANQGYFEGCIYTGLISNLTWNDSFAQSQETYTIVGQGMAKIMSNIKLSTFSDLQSNLTGYQLLPDDEKTGIGFKQHTSANIVKQIINRFVLQNQGGVNTYDYLASQNGEDITTRTSAIAAGDIGWGGPGDLMGAPMTEEQYELYMDAIADSSDDASSSDSDSDDSSQQNTDPTQANNAYANLPQESWLNVPLMVNSNGELPIQNLMEFWIYENIDESYPDAGPSNPFTNYNGSILQMIKDVSSKPFNEMYWTFDRGLSTFNYRPTPFDPENWKSLAITEIEPSVITDINLTENAQEQAAVFKITPTNGLGQTQFDGGWAGNLAPLTNLALIRRYGYSLLEATTDYFNGQSSEGAGDSDSDSSKSDSSDKSNSDNNSSNSSTDTQNNQQQSAQGANQAIQTAGTQGADSEAMKGYTNPQDNYPPYTSIEDAFYLASGRTPGKRGDNLSIPKEVGGVTGYNQVANYLHASSNAHNFAGEVAHLGISEEDANALWTMRNGFNRERYLQIVAPNYQPTSTNMSKNSRYLKSYDRMSKNPEKAASELISELGYTIGPEQAYQLVQAAIANQGIVPEAVYNNILNTIPFTQGHDGVTGGVDGNSVPFLFLMYTRKLFNWNADNSKFYSGTITTHGIPVYNTSFIGERVMFYDDPSQEYFEFYCEGTTISWDYQNGINMTLDVTRGVPLDNDDTDDQDGFNRRFSKPWSFWGQSVPFKGGYFGEQNLATAIANAGKGDSGGTSSNDIVKFAQEVMGKNWTYSMGNRTDFGEIGHPKDGGHADCSSFSWYCAKSCGYDVGDSAFTTISCKSVLEPLDSKDAKAGDMVVNDANPHMGILEEDWKGGDTKVIDMNISENIAEESYSQAFGADSATWWGRPKK